MDHNRNLLDETRSELTARGKAPAEVRWVGLIEPDYLRTIRPSSDAPIGCWEDFERFASFKYDAGYGGAEVNSRLVIVGDDWWLERGEYDGSEWWEFKSLPQKPAATTPLRADDLKSKW